MLWLANQFASGAYDVEEPVYAVWSGLYDPDQEIEDEMYYLERVRQSDLPVVGILTSSNLAHNNRDVPQLDALFRSLKNQGAEPICLFSDLLSDPDIGSEGIHVALERYWMHEGKPVVDSIINTAAFSLSILSIEGDGSTPCERSIFELLQVPVLQAMSTLQSFEEWVTSPRGLDGLSLSWCVFQPEFDGQLITYPVATKEWADTETGRRKVTVPLQERIDQVAKLAIRYAGLGRKPNDKKKIAIILHNNPPDRANIGGAAGLDTPASVYNMVEHLEKAGIKTDYRFDNGKDIIDRIIAGLSNDMSCHQRGNSRT